MDPGLVIVSEYIPEDDHLYFRHLHPISWYPVEQLLFQCGKEALHPGIVVTVAYSAQTLVKMILLQLRTEIVTGVL